MSNWDRFGSLFLISMLVLIVFGLSRMETNTEDVLQWLPDQSDARVDYNFFREHFDSDDFVIFTWNDCSQSDPRLTAVADHLRDLNQKPIAGYRPLGEARRVSKAPSASEPVVRGQGSDRLLSRVSTGLDMTRDLSKKLDIAPKFVAKRLQGVFFGLKDPARTCVLVELSHFGTTKRADVVAMIFAAIEKTPDLDPEQVSLAGYPYIATYINQQLESSYATLLIPSIVLATMISLLCLRSFVLGAIVFVTAVGAAMAAVAITPTLGYQLGGLMSIIPALVFVLATSGAIHLIRYSLEDIGNPAATLRVGWKPCVISTVTTAVGMLSLTRSGFPAIRNFGLFCAIGVCFALAFQLAVVPWLLGRFGHAGLTKLKKRQQVSKTWSWLARQIGQRRTRIAIVFIGILAVGVAGLFRLNAEVEVEKLFRPESQIIQSLTVLETEFGPMDQTELLLVFENASATEMHRRVAFVRQLQTDLKKQDGIEVAYSLVNFLPSPVKRKSAKSFIARAAYHKYLDKNRESFGDESLLALDADADTEIWRISIRFPFIEKVDFEAARETVMATTERVSAQFIAADKAAALAATESSGETAEPFQAQPLPAKSVYTGQTYLFHHAQLTLLQDLFQNFMLAFVIITPMLVIVLRNVKIGLLAMIPNVFPTVAIYGALGWTGHPVDLALAMTACVALGIAVDDTTHFLIRFREFGGSLDSMEGPLEKTIAQCGPAMWHTTLIASASLLTFYFSEMQVVSRFSWAIASLLVVALLADVLMLPALLMLLRKPK